jgi:hypothetical protein
VVASLTAGTTGSQRLLELKLVASLVTQQMTAQLAAPEASSMLQDLMTAHQSASGQISHAPEDQPTTARKKRAGQIDLLITTLVVQNHVVPIHAVQIQEASVSQHLVLTVLGNRAHQELRDLLLTDHTLTETHPTAEPEATTFQIVQHVQTPIVLGNHVHLAPTDLLLTDHTQTETHLTVAQEATTDQTAPQIDQQDLTLTVLGNHALQELIAQSAQGILVDSHLVQTLASLTETVTRSAKTAFRGIVQEMTASLALAIRTQTRRLSSRTRF